MRRVDLLPLFICTAFRFAWAVPALLRRASVGSLSIPVRRGVPQDPSPRAGIGFGCRIVGIFPLLAFSLLYQISRHFWGFFDRLRDGQICPPLSLSKNYCFPILCRVSEAGVGVDASVCPMSSREFSQYSVGADAYIGPPGSCEFAADYRKNGAICRVDVYRQAADPHP